MAQATDPVSAVEEIMPIATEAVPEPTPAVPKTVEKESQAPATSPSTPLLKLFSELPSIIAEAEYREMWGIELKNQSHVPTCIVLEKFLRANIKDNIKDVAEAKAQLIEALKWRRRMQPIKLMQETEFDASKFGGLGYVTVYPKEGGAKEIVTWNIYGAVRDNKATFGDVEE